ncbi:hypothetical protein [Petroclostridium sp. X23]|uniref:hypothetical protein n=1 Tax=Petroclostridium sp. X23 TaxID=3045146 RepID=UPI0024ACD162|nr:hypothetical protein [Petroclostridium sp. X23]WHH59847.1 hypothetical protein QKW49_03610 [Petroclostridium sp. X23]
MLKRELYQKAYSILEQLTPLQTDCGELCNQACCDSDDEDAGMYLFPGEELMYIEKPDWLRIEESAFTYGNEEKPALIAMCTQRCDRELRPLSCRIFPLTPYIGHDGVINIKIDPRAVPMCPLAKPYADKSLDKEFILAVTEVYKILGRDKEIYSFIFDLSRLIDEQ